MSLLMSTPLLAEELRPQLDDLVRHFGNVVFGDEYGVGDAPGVVAKWQESPIGIAVQGHSTDQLIDIAARHIRGLTEITGVQFKKVAPGSPNAKIDLMFLYRQEMSAVAKQLPPRDASALTTMINDPTARCFFLSWKVPNDRIVKAIVLVNAKLEPAEVNACLLEELTQVMGLPNDVDAYWPTLFKPIDSSLNWSRWDKLYLKTLYSPQMKPGLNKAQALEVARTLFAKELSKSP
ncbi:hypothetical protein BEN30_10720 [Magnetovibrio blakemorei]|uniref:Uncharacterized protein n=2 Tax=Magnetovibrio blakemorei TaxID=28181 RepID=A0A1E5Q7Z9_9PROT|nr:hypothetical protein BEN30_10720 [Magnetovibrio blakemorei]